MMEKENLREAIRLLIKYRGVHIVDLMDDVNEKIGVIFLKLSDMVEDEIEEESVFHTLDVFLDEMIAKLTQAKRGIEDIRSEG